MRRRRRHAPLPLGHIVSDGVRRDAQVGPIAAVVIFGVTVFAGLVVLHYVGPLLAEVLS